MEENQGINKLVIVGNGFDLAHGLETSYKHFMGWYMCKAFNKFCSEQYYADTLIEIKNRYSGMHRAYSYAKTLEEALNFINLNDYQSIEYKSNFLKRLLTIFKENKWVDIERYYYRLLKAYFKNTSLNEKTDIIQKLNSEFDFLITQLTNHIITVNEAIKETPKLITDVASENFSKLFSQSTDKSQTKFLNFNYTDTLQEKGYAGEEDIIYIHGRASDLEHNPIIFGYGDETDPEYQNIEDSGDNVYLEHIKSFGYFRTNNYRRLLSYIDSAPYIVYIVGHSCGLSDRVLLNEIFEHGNCQRIDIFYHQTNNEQDNFKEITQEISRHFKPQNKNIMRRKVADKNPRNIIPQNSLKLRL